MKPFFFLFSFLFIISCNNHVKTPFLPIEIIPQLISNGNTFSSTYNPTQHNRVFYSKIEWDSFVENIWSPPSNTETIVDFDKYIVITSFDKPRGVNDLYSIKIKKIIEYEENIVVTVEFLFGGGGTGIAIPRRPYYFVKIPITDKYIIFE